MKNIVILFCLFAFNTALNAQHENHAANANTKVVNPATFKDAALGKAYDQYITLKDALVASNVEASKKAIADLLSALKELKNAADATQAATTFANTTTLAEQRLAFSTLSNEITKLVKGGKLSSGSIYLEYCPMANDDTGAYWLSNEKEIKNPYFGKMMLKCGSVKETIQ